IGEEKFRFYADTLVVAEAAPPVGQTSNPVPAAPPVPPVPPVVPPPPGDARLRETVHGIPSAAAPPGAPRPASGPLASFIVKSGALKGQRLAVKTPVVNIGRADYNDVVLPDESVSTTHAKLQRREGVWILVDLDSTNGTFVDGDQIKGEAPLAPGATLRFGDVTLVFEPTDDGAEVARGGGTRVMEQMVMSPPPRPAPPTKPNPAVPASTPSKPPAAKPGAKPAAAKPVPAKPVPPK